MSTLATVGTTRENCPQVALLSLTHYLSQRNLGKDSKRKTLGGDSWPFQGPLPAKVRVETRMPRPAPSGLPCPACLTECRRGPHPAKTWSLERATGIKRVWAPQLQLLTTWGLLKSPPYASKIEQMFLMIKKNTVTCICVKASFQFKTIFYVFGIVLGNDFSHSQRKTD